MRFVAFKLFSELINPSPVWAVSPRERVQNRRPQTRNRGSSSMSPVQEHNSPIGYETLAAATVAARAFAAATARTQRTQPTNHSRPQSRNASQNTTRPPLRNESQVTTVSETEMPPLSQTTTVPASEVQDNTSPPLNRSPSSSSRSPSPVDFNNGDHDPIESVNDDEEEFDGEEEESSVDDESSDVPGLFGNHTGDGDYSSEFSIHQRILHFLGEAIDQQKNRFNVEACLLIEAGTSVSNERTTTATIRNQMMLDRYVNLVRMFSPDDFVSPTTQEDMAIRLFHGKRGGYNGEKLWRKFEEYRKEIRTKYTPKLPKDISSFPSGHSLRDIYKKFALECYKVEYDVSWMYCRL